MSSRNLFNEHIVLLNRTFISDVLNTYAIYMVKLVIRYTCRHKSLLLLSNCSLEKYQTEQLSENLF